MKSIYYSLTTLLLISVLGFSGCSDEKEVQTIPEVGRPITIIPSVAGMADVVSISRSGVVTLSNLSGKLLVLDITQNASNTGDSYNYTGLEYTIAQDGTMTLTSGASPKWKQYTGHTDRDNVTIKACWPKATEVPIDQSDDGHKEADFLYFGGIPTITGDRIQFELGHVNTKIRINLKHGTGFDWGTTDSNLQTVKLTTKVLAYTTDSENGLWKADVGGAPIASTSATLSSYTAHQETTPIGGQDATFEVIILPQEVTDMSEFFKIVAGTKTYHFNRSESYTFESGKMYTFNLRLGKDQVTLDGGIGVAGWTEDNTIPPGQSEDESRVQTAEALTALISSYDAEYHADNSFRASIIYSSSDAIADETLKNKLWLIRFVATKNITIGNSAFSGCTNLNELVFAASDEMTGITGNTFTGLTTTNTINLIIGAEEYGAITSDNLSAKTWRGQTWKSINKY